MHCSRKACRQGRCNVIDQELSPTKAVSIWQYLGQCAIRLAFMDSCFVDPFVLFSADLRAEKDHQKHLFFNDFSLLYLHHYSPSIIRHSTTNTSLSHPRCRHWPYGHGLFSFFVGMLSRYTKGFLPDRA